MKNRPIAQLLCMIKVTKQFLKLCIFKEILKLKMEH